MQIAIVTDRNDQTSRWYRCDRDLCREARNVFLSAKYGQQAPDFQDRVSVVAARWPENHTYAPVRRLN